MKNGREWLKSIDQLDIPESKVVPKFIFNWIKNEKGRGKTLLESTSYINAYGWDDETHIDYQIYKFMHDNGDLIAEAWVNGCVAE